MAVDGQPGMVIEPSLDHPGWLTFDLTESDRYNRVVLGPLIMRQESERTCRLRCFPGLHLRNITGALHGGCTLGLIDVSLFAGLRLLAGIDTAAAVTLDLSTQFIGAGRVDQPLDAVVELLRETRRLAFLRGMVEQEGQLIASFHGTVRKATAPQ